MSKDLNNNSSEEIDITQLFNFFESKVKAFLCLIFKAFKSIFEVIISFLKTIQKHAIKIGLLLVVATVSGYVYDMYKPKVYSSTMMVKPMFDSKYQLFTNIQYYNALIMNGDDDKISSVFEISKEEASNLSSFIMRPGPENENEKILAYDKFIKSVDSSTAKMIKYDQFIEHMSVYNSSIYEVTVNSTQRDIFSKLAPGFIKTFETPFSKKSKAKKDAIYKLKKESLEKQLRDVDTLQKMYIKELSRTQNKEVSTIAGTPIIVGDEKNRTREFDAFELSLKIRNELTRLEQINIEEDKLFEVVSDFPAIGTIKSTFRQKMKIMFPGLTFFMALLIIFGLKFNKYIKNYNLD